MTEFAERLRLRRAALGLSQEALAGPGLSESYLSRLESGARPPTWPVVVRLAERLRCEPRDLLPPAQWPARSLVAAVQQAQASGRDAVAAELLDQTSRVRGDGALELHKLAGEYYVSAGMPDRGLRRYATASATALESGQFDAAVECGIAAVDAALDLDELGEADTVLQSLQATVPAGVLDVHGSQLLRAQAELALRRGDIVAALESADAARGAASGPGQQAAAMRVQAHALFELGEHQRANETIEQAVQVATGTDAREHARATLVRAYLGTATRGIPPDRLLDELRHLEASRHVSGNRSERHAIRLEQARLLTQLGKPAEALRITEAVAGESDLSPLTLARADRIAADALWALDRRTEATAAYHAAADELLRRGLTRMAARTLAALAARQAQAGRRSRAIETYQQALAAVGITATGAPGLDSETLRILAQ